MCTLCAANPFQPMDHSLIGAEINEGVDAAAGTSTAYEISPGDTFNGTLSTDTDEDWVAVDLVAGMEYTISLTGTGSDPVSDTYLELYSSGGTLLGANDDGGPGLYSQMTFTATSTGTYYVNASSYYTGPARGVVDTGDYIISVSTGTEPEPLEEFTYDQIADQLTEGYWGSERSWDVAPGGTITVNISGLNAGGQAFALAALESWTNVTGINFQVVTGEADMTFDDNDSGAYASNTTSGSTIIGSDINVSTSWIASDWNSTTGEIDLDSYSFQTYIHEIGHALGLGHAGNYNGSASYPNDAHYTNDSWQATVMSYFSQTENSAVDASFAYILTPMMADIIAIQNLYGTPTNQRTGDTTYGANSNAGGYLDNLLGLSSPVAFTIYDNGGIDTLDLSFTNANNVVNLYQEGISDVGGLTGNISIARGTDIENLILGGGNDMATGSNVDNALYGGAGNDTLDGASGDDLLDGGAGSDSLDGGAGDDTIDAGATQGDATISGSADNFIITTSTGTDTVTGVEYIEFYDTIVAVSDLLGGDDTLPGSSDDDVLTGTAGDDTLDGGSGNDTISGGSGDDLIFGGSGDDVLTGGAGLDIIYGGDDTGNGDTLALTDNSTDVEVFGVQSLSLGLSGTGITDTNLGGVNGISGVEYVQFADTLMGAGDLSSLSGWIGTVTDGDDSLVGTDANSVLVGAQGNDTLIGNGGHDYLEGFSGDDLIYGGSGVDIVYVDADQASATVSGTTGSFVIITASGTDTVEGVEYIAFSDAVVSVADILGGDDTLPGSSDDDMLIGTSGHDTLYGGTGNDTLSGGAGHDTLFGGADNDVLYGSSGDDQLFGGAGADSLYGGSWEDLLDGGSGDDFIELGSGFDFAFGGAGVDTVSVGINEADAEIMSVDLTLGEDSYYGVLVNYGADGAVIDGVEHVQFLDGTTAIGDLVYSGSITNGNDVQIGGSAGTGLDGFAGDDTLYGNGGNDEIYGGADNDVIFGGSGDDYIEGESGDDLLDGGSGEDTFYADASQGDATISGSADNFIITTSTGTDTVTGVEYIAFDDTIVAVSDLLGGDDTLPGSSDDDVLTGTAGDDTLDGGSGNDTISGGSGDDFIFGGSGDDVLTGGAGLDIIYGGDDTGNGDTLVLSVDSTDLEFFDIQTTLLGFDGTALIDADAANFNLISDVEYIQFADTIIATDDLSSLSGWVGSVTEGDDSIVGTDANSFLTGVGGNDTLFGNGGDDFLEGGDGNDLIYGGSGDDTVILYVDQSTATISGSADNLIITTDEGTDTLVGVEYIEFFDDTVVAVSDLFGGITDATIVGTAGDDTLIGGSGGDDIYGGAGEDIIIGEDGYDTLYGGSGDDELDGWGDADTIYGDIGNDVLLGWTGTDRLFGGSGEDSLYGEQEADSLWGGNDDDLLYGGEDADVLFGGNQEDTLYGGEDSDVLYGNAGFDLLYGGTGDDVLDGGAQADNLYGDAGADALIGGFGFDRLFGGAGADTLQGDGGTDGLYGGSGDDSLSGGVSSDQLAGGDGDDTLDGGSHADNLFGGGDNDLAYGGQGFDRFFLGSGNDTAFGGSETDAFFAHGGNDYIDGGSGDDRMYGGGGFDTIVGGAGDDTLEGNFNADTFVFADGFGQDVITDFNANNNFERIDLSAVGAITDFSDLSTNHMVQDGGNVIISDGAGNSITLQGVTLGDLHEIDFVF